MTNAHTLFHLDRMFAGLCIAMHIGRKNPDGSIDRVTNLTLEKHDPNTAIRYESPALELTEADAQNLIDELWHLGVRPTEGHGSTGQLAATEKHLDHTTALLNQTLQTVLNVANASLITQHGLKTTEA